LEETQGVFIRRASGLVRDMSPTQLIFFNFLTQGIWPGVALAFTQNPVTFSGENVAVGLAIIAVLGTAFFIAYSIVYSAFPRVGTDYVFQSRVLTPAIGFASAMTAWVIYQFWYVAFYEVDVINTFIAPWLTALSYSTSNQYFASLATSLSQVPNLLAFSFIAVVLTGAILMGGLRAYVKVQTALMILSSLSFVIIIALLIGTSNASFVSNFNAYMSSSLGKTDSYNYLISSAQQAGYNLSPPFSLYATMGAMILPWIFALEWPVFGNLSLGGETQSADRLKTQALSMLVPFYMGIVAWGVVWYLFVGMVGERFWNAVSYLTWNASSVVANVPSALYFPFVVAIGTNNPWMTGLFSITASIMIMCANFTIFIVCTRMIFAMTFDRLFPKRIADISRRTRAPVYALLVIVVISLLWVVGVLYYGTTLSSWFGSVQVQISFTQILTMVGALLFRKRLKHLYEQSAAARHRVALIISAVIGIGFTLMIIYYMLAIPALYASLPQSEALILILFLASIGYYYGVRLYRRRTSIDIALAFKEIPPS